MLAGQSAGSSTGAKSCPMLCMPCSERLCVALATCFLVSSLAAIMPIVLNQFSLNSQGLIFLL